MTFQTWTVYLTEFIVFTMKLPDGIWNYLIIHNRIVFPSFDLKKNIFPEISGILESYLVLPDKSPTSSKNNISIRKISSLLNSGIEFLSLETQSLDLKKEKVLAT